MASRPKRWHKAIAEAQAAAAELIDLRDEYQEWYDNLPEGLDQSPVAEKLEAITELDIDGLNDILEEAEAVELPLGFGRD